MSKYLSIKEASEKIGVSPETMRRWDKNGKFNSIRHPINNYRVYTEEQVTFLVNEMQLEIEYHKNDSKSLKKEPFFET